MSDAEVMVICDNHGIPLAVSVNIGIPTLTYITIPIEFEWTCGYAKKSPWEALDELKSQTSLMIRLIMFCLTTLLIMNGTLDLLPALILMLLL